MGTKISLSNAFFSKVQQRLLALLYGQPEQSFNTNEIIRNSLCGRGAVQRELEKLTLAGILTTKPIGNQKHYQANSAMPFFNELRSIILKTFGLADVIKLALQPCATQIQFAFIYGSIAKQTDNANSDIDLLLISNQLSYPDLYIQLQKAESELGRPINPSIYSFEELKLKIDQENNFLLNVMQQPKIFLIGDENEFIKLR